MTWAHLSVVVEGSPLERIAALCSVHGTQVSTSLLQQLDSWLVSCSKGAMGSFHAHLPRLLSPNCNSHACHAGAVLKLFYLVG